MRSLVKFDDVLQEQLKNPEFKKCFDEAGAEYATFKNAMEARKGILPSHASLVKYASALGKRVVITFV